MACRYVYIVSSVVLWSSLLRWLVLCFHSSRITWWELMWINEDRRALNSELTEEDGGIKKTVNRVWQALNLFFWKHSSPYFPVFQTDVLFVNITTGVTKTRGRGRSHPNLNPHPKTALFKKKIDPDHGPGSTPRFSDTRSRQRRTL